MMNNIVREVLFITGREGGIQPGSFGQHLIETFFLADSSNFAKLSMAFPEYARAVAASKFEGPDALMALLDE